MFFIKDIIKTYITNLIFELSKNMSKKILSIFVFVLVLSFSTQAYASLTFTTDAITGTSASTIDLGAGNTLSLQTSGGNVGIGTTTPNNLLQVADLIIFDNTDFNTKLGYQAGKYVVSGAIDNTYIGYQAGSADNATGKNNWANGNTGIGYRSLYSHTTGAYNTANGMYSLFTNTAGEENTAQGFQSLYSNTDGYNNSAQGAESLYSNTEGNDNTAQGAGSLYFNTTGRFNTAQGVDSLLRNTTGNYNSVQGVDSLSYNATGTNNSAIGYKAGSYITDGFTGNTTVSNSLFLGYDTRAQADGQTNQIVIGSGAIGLGSNTVVLGNNSIVTTALKGNVGIGTTTPGSKLSIVGLPAYANNAAALAGGLVAGDLYYTDTAGEYVVKITH